MYGHVLSFVDKILLYFKEREVLKTAPPPHSQQTTHLGVKTENLS